MIIVISNETFVCKMPKSPRKLSKPSPYGTKQTSPTKLQKELAKLESLVPQPIHKKSWFYGRLHKAGLVNELLDKVPTDLFQICFSGKNTLFRDQLSTVKTIGQGGFGTVYIAKLEDQEFVVKEALISSEEKTNMESSRGKPLVIKNSYPEEYRIMSLLNNSIYSNQCPNFLMAYNLAVCDGCVLPNQKSGSCYISFIEPALGDLSLLDGEKITNGIAVSILFQLLVALSCIHSVYGIFHGDIKKENILIQRINPGGFFKYTINDKTFYVENRGLVVFLNDFGLSQVYKPSFSKTTFYGTRNAKVVDGHLEAITCKYGSRFSSYKVPATRVAPQKLIWEDGQIGTNNQFGIIDIFPTEIVDLNDTVKFPPMEFSLDIQDLLLTFVSGPSITQAVPHPGLSGISSDFTSIISKHVIARFPYSSSSVNLLRADLLLEELYQNMYINVDRSEIIESFEF
jgi:serine/threonine protein kinase